MKLSTINNLLEKIGLVLVIGVDENLNGDIPTQLWIERKTTYTHRCGEKN